jgi:hypothetical protein
MAVSKNKVCLKGAKISKYDDGNESYSKTGVRKLFPTMAASLG